MNKMKERLSRLVVLALLILLSISMVGNVLHFNFGVGVVKAAPIFSDGFESGTITTSDSPPGAWDGSDPAAFSTIQVVASPVHSGSYALYLSTDGVHDTEPKVWKNLPEYATAYGRCYVRFGSLNLATDGVLIVWVIGAQAWDLFTTQVRVYNNSGTLIWELYTVDDGANIQAINCSSGPVINQWYCVELERIQDASNGGAVMWVDGVKVASVMGLNTELTGYTDQCLCDAESIWYSAQNNYFDDVVIASSYIGPISGAPPTVSISPTSVTMDVGQLNLFTSTVSGGASPYSYQWYLNNASISGAMNPTWTFTPTSSGSYNVYLNVTDSASEQAKSNIASVTVNPALSVSILPTSVTLDVGRSQPFTSIVSKGTSPYSYQWYLNNAPVSGATNPAWTFTPTSSGSYTVYLNVTDGTSKKAKSNIASVSVRVVPIVPDFSISASPSSLMIVRGASGTSTINITSIDSFNSAVSLVISGAPSGVTLTLGPTSVTPVSGGFVTSTLTVVVNARTAPGSCTLTVTGTSGSLTHKATISLIVTQSRVVKACVEFEPEELNLKSEGKWIICFIKLPKGYNASDLDPSTIMLNGTIRASKAQVIWDCDHDTVIGLVVKFNRTEVQQFILDSTHLKKGSMTVELTVTGFLKDGTQFQGTDKIKVALHNHHDHHQCIHDNGHHHNDHDKHNSNQ